MPAGVSMGQYLKFLTCAMISMMAGSQIVHSYYKPLQDLDIYIEQELKQNKVLGLADSSGNYVGGDNRNNVTKNDS